MRKPFAKSTSGNDQPELMRDHLSSAAKTRGESIAFNNLYMEQNGHPVVPVMGEFHYVRTPEAEWDQSLKKIKAAGVNIVSTYVFWNVHEETEGKFDWSGDERPTPFHRAVRPKRSESDCPRRARSAMAKCETAVCPIGCTAGRLMSARTIRLISIMSNGFYNEIGKQLVGLLFKDGGPIIGFQIENEYHHSAAPWAFSYPGQAPEWTVADENRYWSSAANGPKNEDDPYRSDGHKHMANLLELRTRPDSKRRCTPPPVGAMRQSSTMNHSRHLGLSLSDLGPCGSIAVVSVSRFAQATGLLSRFLSAGKLSVVCS